MSWRGQVERRVARWIAAGLGTRWVVAVSGGGDSVGLVRVLRAGAPELGLTLSVAHLDHGARGAAGRADAAFVEDLARSLGLPFDLGRWSPTRPGHFESDARSARHAWLVEVAQARGAAVVAMGHTRDDQAETVLHRIIRGAGVRGLAGIPARRRLGDGVTLVRPLLDVSRQEVRDQLAVLNQPYRDDATNADLAQTRARLRHDLLPKLADEYNPRVADALTRLARLARASDRATRARIEDVARWAARPGATHDELSLDRDRLMTVSAFLRAEAIRLAWRRAGWPEAGMSARRWRRLANLGRLARAGRCDVVGGIAARIDPDGRLVLSRPTSAPEVRAFPTVPAGSVALPIPGSVSWPDGRVVVTLDVDAPRGETIDLDRLDPPLLVRAPRPGDRFAPLGMDDHAQPLNDFFRGRHVPIADRARTPLVCDRLGIVWVVNHRLAHRVRLTDSTTRRAGLSWEPHAIEPDPLPPVP